MNEYTPTTERVRSDYAETFEGTDERRYARFDRWLDRIERAAAARALAWAAEHLSDGLRYEDILEINSWEAVTVCAGILRARAAEIRSDHGHG